ncbi:MAG: T9SS type A sorting domain-containing protein [Flavobacteriales bacterium]|nr:T9SS type A sorting domain-containing protein [Flavobacteriales bacterium]
MIKRLHLLTASCFAALALQAQVTVYVQEPPALQGSLEFTVAEWGQNPPLSDPANAVTAYACFVDDGTAADSLGCNALVNGAELAGKIAVVYRGECEFGVKALNAQTAGAVAVVIINNAAGAPVAMGAGAQGANVTIPVVMISLDAGALLYDELQNCNVQFYIGTQTGVYAFNLATTKDDILIPRYGAINSLVASNASEFSVELGAWMFNYGQNEMPNARVRCEVTQNGSSVVYDQTTTGVNLPVGDSIYVSLPTFSQSSYSGQYSFAYSIAGDVSDDFPENNAASATLTIGDKITYAPADAITQLPIANLHVISASNTTGLRSCMYFSNPNASRLAATGLWFSADRAATDVLTDEIVTGTLYQWTDAIANQITLPTDVGLISLTSGEYIFDADLFNQPIFIPFLDQVALVDNQNYLLCLDSYSGIVRHGWDNSLGYDLTQAVTLLPATMIRVDGTWYNGWTGITGPASLAMQVINSNSIGIEENELVTAAPYPNPTMNQIRIPLNLSGKVDVRAFDLAGNLVLEQRSSTAGPDGLLVDVSGVTTGMYVFRILAEDGRTSEFRVQVNK